MSDREDMGRRAVTEALRLRGSVGRALHAPVCPIDLALDAGIEVRFEALSTLEGLYTPDGPLIILGSLRPRGRRAYTCAHELGHHVFLHGSRIDELEDEPSPRDPNEVLADRFAAALLMPKLAVLNAFSTRKWNPESCTPEEAFTIATFLGVGYTTLIGYLQGTLHTLGGSHANMLRRATPKSIRSRVLGWDPPADLIVVDELWVGRPVDVELGDVLLVPSATAADGGLFDRLSERALRVRASGSGQLRCGSWTAEVRSMRDKYTGLAEYRHLEASDDDV